MLLRQVVIENVHALLNASQSLIRLMEDKEAMICALGRKFRLAETNLVIHQRVRQHG